MSPSLWRISIAPTSGGVADEHEERLTRMFAALSETNEAIMRAQTRAELFQLVCEAAVHGGRFASTHHRLDRAGQRLPARRRGRPAQRRICKEPSRMAITEAHPEGRG